MKIVLHEPAPSADLPAGVSLEPGLLTISFSSEEQLLERLFLIARAFANKPSIISNLAKS